MAKKNIKKIENQDMWLEMKYVPVSKLVPYSRNARTHSKEQIEQLKNIISEVGFVDPILIDGDKGIIAGHGRVLAAKELGIDKIPTIELSYLSELQKKNLILAHNKIAQNSGWDEEILALELFDIKEMGGDLLLTGWSVEEAQGLLIEKPTKQKKPKNETATPTSQPGDIWTLGQHTLTCGENDHAETDMIIKTWQNFSGKKAVLQGSEVTLDELSG